MIVRTLAFALGCAACPGCSSQKTPAGAPEAAELLARFEPSPGEVVDVMLNLAAPTSKDVVYDLGCGDGRIVIEAAKRFGAHGVGLDIDPSLITLARERAREAGVGHLVELRVEDVLKADVSPATVVMLFLSPRGNAKLEERLRTQLRPGSRIISHCHPMEDWAPDKTIPVTAGGREHTVYLWTVRGAEVAPSLGPFVPTPMPVVRKMLEVAEVKPDDVVYDLGCGDGRIVIEAARAYGARGVGIDFDLRLCKEARERAAREGVSERVEIRHEDLTGSDFSDATVVALYLLPQSNEALRPKLAKLKPGTRIVAHQFPIGDWKPLRAERMWIRGKSERDVGYLWRGCER